jgi:hypothetical protein
MPDTLRLCSKGKCGAGDGIWGGNMGRLVKKQIITIRTATYYIYYLASYQKYLDYLKIINDVNLIGSNMGVTKMNTLIQPLLMYLGLDMLSPSTLTLLMVTFIVIGMNSSSSRLSYGMQYIIQMQQKVTT